jgi:hypothetical protein
LLQPIGVARTTEFHGRIWVGLLNPRRCKAAPGDVFFGLDFSLDTVRRYRRQLAQFRKGGGQLWFLMYDLLPVERPGWFSTYNVIRFKAGLQVLAGIADAFLYL